MNSRGSRIWLHSAGRGGREAQEAALGGWLDSADATSAEPTERKRPTRSLQPWTHRRPSEGSQHARDSILIAACEADRSWASISAVSEASSDTFDAYLEQSPLSGLCPDQALRCDAKQPLPIDYDDKCLQRSQYR